MYLAYLTAILWLLLEVFTAEVVVLFVVVLVLLAAFVGILVLVFFRR